MKINSLKLYWEIDISLVYWEDYYYRKEIAEEIKLDVEHQILRTI